MEFVMWRPVSVLKFCAVAPATQQNPNAAFASELQPDLKVSRATNCSKLGVRPCVSKAGSYVNAWGLRTIFNRASTLSARMGRAMNWHESQITDHKFELPNSTWWIPAITAGILVLAFVLALG
jgi:hypothetical protein